MLFLMTVLGFMTFVAPSSLDSMTITMIILFTEVSIKTNLDNNTLRTGYLTTADKYAFFAYGVGYLLTLGRCRTSVTHLYESVHVDCVGQLLTRLFDNNTLRFQKRSDFKKIPDEFFSKFSPGGEHLSHSCSRLWLFLGVVTQANT